MRFGVKTRGAECFLRRCGVRLRCQIEATQVDSVNFRPLTRGEDVRAASSRCHPGGKPGPRLGRGRAGGKSGFRLSPEWQV